MEGFGKDVRDRGGFGRGSHNREAGRGGAGRKVDGDIFGRDGGCVGSWIGIGLCRGSDFLDDELARDFFHFITRRDVGADVVIVGAAGDGDGVVGEGVVGREDAVEFAGSVDSGGRAGDGNSIAGRADGEGMLEGVGVVLADVVLKITESCVHDVEVYLGILVDDDFGEAFGRATEIVDADDFGI